jgi:predicted acylesterase/phospholipase RssA
MPNDQLSIVDHQSSMDLALTLAGGGNRAFWQIGMLERWWDRLLPRVGGIAACSAGASSAVTWLSGRQADAHRFWLDRRRHVTRNFLWQGVLPGRRLTPHEPIYRATLAHALAEGGLDRIRALPFPVLILTASLPRWLPARIATVVGMTAYSIERELNRGKLHPAIGRRLGFRPVVVDARSCETPADLVDLVLASSATPPFTGIGRHRGIRLLDGGMVDNAPAFVADAVPGVRRNLVLLTRPYPPASVGWQGSRLYLCPTLPVPINRWDYTRLERVEATLELGRQDAVRHEEAIRRFLTIDD